MAQIKLVMTARVKFFSIKNYRQPMYVCVQHWYKLNDKKGSSEANFLLASLIIINRYDGMKMCALEVENKLISSSKNAHFSLFFVKQELWQKRRTFVTEMSINAKSYCRWNIFDSMWRREMFIQPENQHFKVWTILSF